MRVSSIRPARRRQSNETMREVNKHINQIPMPNRIRTSIWSSLHKPIIGVPSGHIMTNQNPRSLRHGGRRKVHRGEVEGEVKWIEESAGFEVLERGERVGNRNRRCERVERRRIGGGSVVGHCGGEKGAEGFEGWEEGWVGGLYMRSKSHGDGVEYPLMILKNQMCELVLLPNSICLFWPEVGPSISMSINGELLDNFCFLLFCSLSNLILFSWLIIYLFIVN